MDEFRVKTFAPGWLEVERKSTGHTWQFAIEADADGRRTVVMHTMAPAEAAESGAMQAALDYARRLAVRIGRADG